MQYMFGITNKDFILHQWSTNKLKEILNTFLKTGISNRLSRVFTNSQFLQSNLAMKSIQGFSP